LFLPGDGHVFRNLSEAIVSGKLPLDSVMYQDIANTADNIKESWTTRFRTREPLRAWFLAMNDEQSGARAIEGMRGPMGFRRNTIRFDSVHQLRINKFAPSGWTLRQWAKAAYAAPVTSGVDDRQVREFAEHYGAKARATQMLEGHEMAPSPAEVNRRAPPFLV
jgi:hypothetical protein